MINSSQNNTYPETLDDKGVVPPRRVKDGEAAYAIYARLRQDDEGAAYQRAAIGNMVDGGKPYDDGILLDAGMGDATNVNFMEGKAEEDSSQTPYIELTSASEILWECHTAVGDEKQRWNDSMIVSREFSRMVREWDGEPSDFTYYKLRLAQQYNRHGISFLYWDNEIDWRWRCDGLNNFRIPRDLESRPSAVPYATCDRWMSVTDLYGFIRDEENVRAMGRWNVEAVQQAIIDAGKGSSRRNSWERFVQSSRENDIGACQDYDKVAVYHMWMKEFNNEISHYIGLQSGHVKKRGMRMIGNGFLYEHRFRFRSMQECIIPFTYGIGTHGTFHTIRGMGELNFGPIQISNRIRCKWLDSLKASISVLLEAETPSQAQDVGITHIGPYLVVTGGKINPNTLPDTSERMLPALRDMQLLRQNITGSFQSRAISEGANDYRTKYEIEAQQAQEGKLGASSMELFIEPWSKAGLQMYRRAVLNDTLREDDPGGKGAFEMIMRCLSQGVSMEALRSVYKVEAVRLLGNGSPSARQYAAEKIWSLSGSFDEVGRHASLKDMVASIPGVGWQNADRYVGPETPRNTADDSIAELENNDFRSGQSLQVDTFQNHWVHCQHHAPLVTELAQGMQTGQLDPQTGVVALRAVMDNMLAHSEQMNLDPSRVSQAAGIRKFLQNNSGVLQQMETKVLSDMRKQQQSQEQAASGQEGGMDQETAMRLSRMQLEIEEMQKENLRRQQEWELKMTKLQEDSDRRRMDAEQRRAERDLMLSAKLAEKTTAQTP